jgi:hypothetical protein
MFAKSVFGYSVPDGTKPCNARASLRKIFYIETRCWIERPPIYEILSVAAGARLPLLAGHPSINRLDAGTPAIFPLYSRH